MHKNRTRIFIFSVFTVLFLLLLRFFHISVVKNEPYSFLAFSQQNRTREIRKIRGTIYDRNMKPITGTGSRTEYIGEGGAITTGKTQFNFQTTVRYDKSHSATHIIGYTNGNSDGVCGIEKAFNTYLKSDSCQTISYFADATGSPVADFREYTEKENINSAVLTIDLEIQEIAEKIADKYITSGAIVIMDIETFDIIACVSRPDFNPSTPGIYISSGKGELINRAFRPYNAGSVFKIVTACTALEANPEYKNRFFYCTGCFSPDGNASFSCHKLDGHGVVSMPRAFADSCNTAFYETGLCCDSADVCTLAYSLGLGKTVLPFDLGESTGNIPLKTDYTPYESINLSIGQGEILITPLQCTQMTAVIANNGIKKQTNIIKKITNEKNITVKNLYVQKSSRAVSAETAKTVGAMMRETVKSGTASAASNSKALIAGKTGSAQTGWQNNDGSLKVHGWFCGFFPYDNPRYAMTVFSEDGKSGAATCVEPFVQIAEEIMKK